MFFAEYFNVDAKLGHVQFSKSMTLPENPKAVNVQLLPINAVFNILFTFTDMCIFDRSMKYMNSV